MPPIQVSAKASAATGQEGIGTIISPTSAATWMSASQKRVFLSPGAGRHQLLAQGRVSRNSFHNVARAVVRRHSPFGEDGRGIHDRGGTVAGKMTDGTMARQGASSLRD